MTRAAILYNLNSINLKLENIIRNREKLPNDETTDKYTLRYCEYLNNIIGKAQQLLKKLDNGNI